MRRVLLVVGILIVGISNVNGAPPNPPLNSLMIFKNFTPYNLDSPYYDPDSLALRYNGLFLWANFPEDSVYYAARAENKFQSVSGLPTWRWTCENSRFNLNRILATSDYFRLEACDGNTEDPIRPQDNWQTSAWRAQYKGIKDNEAEASWNYALFVDADSGAGIVLDGLVNSLFFLEHKTQTLDTLRVTDLLNKAFRENINKFRIEIRARFQNVLREDYISISEDICTLFVVNRDKGKILIFPITLSHFKRDANYSPDKYMMIDTTFTMKLKNEYKELPINIRLNTTGKESFIVDYIEFGIDEGNR